MERLHDATSEATPEILTLVPSDAEACAPDERMAVTFSLSDLLWGLQRSNEIRRSGDESVYQITTVVLEGASLITAVVSRTRMRLPHRQ